MPKTVPELMREAAAIFEERGKTYGPSYIKFGPIIAELFPDGVDLKTDSDFRRFGIFVQIVGKITRYAEMFYRGGHDDSLLDLSVYATMLREVDLMTRDKS